MERSLQTELLDSLPPTHPDALHNRRDLRLTNAFMGNHRWIARTLRRLVRPSDRVLEIGAGTGELGLRLRRYDIVADGLDLWPRPTDWPPNARWHRADLRSFDRWSDYPVVFGNLILHQFTDDELRTLGERLAHARVIIACEPQRRRVFQAAFRLLAPLFGANRVSRHDAHVSIAAGFRDDELPRALCLDPSAWHVECRATARGAYHLIAVRRTCSP